jgi:hypothetical protein
VRRSTGFVGVSTNSIFVDGRIAASMSETSEVST